MSFRLNAVGHIALSTADLDRAKRFYGDVLGLRKLYRFGDLVSFDCAGMRLMLEKAPAGVRQASTLYFRCADIALAARSLVEKGVVFREAPRRIAPMEDHDLWMAFFEDPVGHLLALMMEASKGYQPA